MAGDHHAHGCRCLVKSGYSIGWDMILSSLFVAWAVMVDRAQPGTVRAWGLSGQMHHDVLGLHHILSFSHVPNNGHNVGIHCLLCLCGAGAVVCLFAETSQCVNWPQEFALQVWAAGVGFKHHSIQNASGWLFNYAHSVFSLYMHDGRPVVWIRPQLFSSCFFALMLFAFGSAPLFGSNRSLAAQGGLGDLPTVPCLGRRSRGVELNHLKTWTCTHAEKETRWDWDWIAREVSHQTPSKHQARTVSMQFGSHHRNS